MSDTVEDDRLISEVRGYAELTVGHGMGIQVLGGHLRAVLERIDTLQAAVDKHDRNGHTPPPPEPWQAPLSMVIRIVSDILESDDYADLCGTNLVDAIHAWAARNHTAIDKTAVAAVERALSGE